MIDTFPSDLGKWRSISAVILLALLLTWESLWPFFGYFAGRTRDRLKHALRNLFLGALNAIAVGVVFAAFWLATARWAEAHHFGLLHWVSLPNWARVIPAVLLFDAWMYWWHRLNHRIPLLWRFHRTHHSDLQMDVTTANRFHVGEIVLSSILRVPIIAIVGLRIPELVLYELMMFAVVQFHHANIYLPAAFDRALRGVIVTPFMHKMHHSDWGLETDSNYSSLLSVWDRVFRSFRMRQQPREIQFGLRELSGLKYQTLSGLLTTPLQNVSRQGTDKGMNRPVAS